jgi:DNA polymerase-3 subunit gamma/tau
VSYQVFARKYRPQTFDDLVGQAHVSQTLKNAVEQNRLAHAYLFVGPRGVGKTSTARILAKSLNCLSVDRPTTTPCNKCSNCVEIAAGNNMDVLEIDGASNNKVDEVRVLTDNVRYAPANSRFKIYLIDEVHMLTPGAFNALLKTLEEPPAHVKFIFATTEPQKVLQTILSRCQRFDLHRIPANLIAQHLQYIANNEKITLAPEAASAIARGAEGGLRDAESMLDQLVAFCGEKIAESDVLNVFGFTSQQTVADLTDRILRGATGDAVQLLHDQSESGKDMMKLMSDLIGYLRDLLVFKVKPDALAEDADPELQKSLSAQAGLVETDRLLQLIDQFAEAEGRMKWAPNKKLHFEVALIKAIQTLDQVTLNEVIENLNALRDGKPKSGTGTAGPARTAEPVRSKSDPRPAGTSSSKRLSSPPPSRPSQPAKSADSSTSAKGETAASASANSDPAAIWQQVRNRIPAARGFLRTLIDALTVVGPEGRNFVLAYPPDEKSAIETLITSANRKQLEQLINEISGKDWTVKFEAREGTPSRKASPDSTPASEYKDDPLIQEALEMFKGEIRS